jgi:hypothetical protein
MSFHLAFMAHIFEATVCPWHYISNEVARFKFVHVNVTLGNVAL